MQSTSYTKQQGCTKFLLIKSGGEEYQVVKRGSKYHSCGEEYNVEKKERGSNIVLPKYYDCLDEYQVGKMGMLLKF